MDIENRIRTRAYFKWLERPAKGPPSELDDWLAAEREELALDLIDAATEAVLPDPSFTQDDAWYGSDRIANLFGLLKRRVRKRRTRSYMLSLIDDYQDYLTSSAAVSDVEANRQASNALRIYRIVASLKVLVGDSFARTADLLPCFRTKLSMISAKERGTGYVEEQAHGGADDRGAEASGGRTEGGRRGA